MTNNARLAEVERAYRRMVMNGIKCELSAKSDQIAQIIDTE
jgi:hypothetical protein